MKFTLHPGIHGAMDSKVQWLETSDNVRSQVISILFGTKIASMCGAVAEKNMRHQMQVDGWTDGRMAFKLYIMTSKCTCPTVQGIG